MSFIAKTAWLTMASEVTADYLGTGRKLNTSFGQNSQFLMKQETNRHYLNSYVNIISFPNELIL